MQRLTAKELQRRYRTGERYFAEVDLSGESLRGINLQGIDLSRADLSRTDIRGTNFTRATLVGTQFVAAKAGTQRRWMVPQLLVALALAAICSFLVSSTWALFALSIFSPHSGTTGSITGNIAFGVLGITLSTGFLGLTYARGVLAALGTTLGTLVLAAALAVADVFGVVFAIDGAVAVAGAAIVTIAFAGAVVVAVVLGIAGTVAVAFAVAFAIASAVAGAVASTADAAGELVAIGIGESVAIGIGIISFLVSININFLIAKRALKGDPRDVLICNFCIWISSWGGTKVVSANLTDASFLEATLKNTHLYQANLLRTNFHLARKVNLSRVGETILANFSTQNLLVTLRGNGQSFIGINLKGAYLAGADLVDADLTEADISQAVLEGAALERTNLTKTQALGTNFHRAILTGATLEAWNIDSTTNLDGAICDYVYLLRNHQERRPCSGTFAPGDFTKLFQEMLDTIDLIFQNGIDWKAFIQTFKQIQEQYSEAQLSIQSIENKGDGVVVVKLNAIPGTNKPVIHQSFNDVYQLALKEMEALYRAQLDAKNEQISDFREQVNNFRRRNADLHELAKLKARQPVTIDVKNVEKIVQGNDNSRNISIGGNATNSIIQAGDGNTAELQHVTLPPPDRVNIQAELAALQAILAGLNDPVTTGIAAKLDAESAKPAPDKSVVATTLETGLTYARNLQGFAEAIDKLRPHVQNAAGWLGEHGTKLLPLVGLAL